MLVSTIICSRDFVGTFCIFASFLRMDRSFSLFLLTRFFLRLFFPALETFAFARAKTHLSSFAVKRLFQLRLGFLFIPFGFLSKEAK